MALTGMRKGQNLDLPSGPPRYQAAISWANAETTGEVDLSALLLTSSGRVRSDLDMVFFNQPASVDGAVRYLGNAAAEDRTEARVVIDLEALDSEVHAVVLAASVDTGTFHDLRDLHLELRDVAGEAFVRFDVADVSTERAMLFGELYRRNQSWRFRAVGQGWDSGLAGLATDFGISVSDESPPGDEPAPAAQFDPGSAGPADPAPIVDEAEGSTAQVIELPDADGDDLVGLVEATPRQADHDAQDAAGESGGAETRAQLGVAAATGTRTTATGVQTRKSKPRRPRLPTLVLAGDESWQAARLFSIAGVGPAAEQEKRATSALLASMMAVRGFGRGMTARFGAPSGVVEAYLEVPFPLGERTVSPDGVIRIARGGRVWTALIETKTGTSSLRRDQVENYLDVAREQGFDAVITLSNDISPAMGEHPVVVDSRKLKRVTLHHISWSEVLHEAKMVLAHAGLDDVMHAWILNELIRYLTHPRSGAVTYNDMGPAWVGVREAVAAGTLRASDRKTPLIAEAWARLIRQLSLELTADLGATVSQILPRKRATDRQARLQAVSEQLASAGTLEATLRIPDAAGPLTVLADLRTTQVRVSATIDAPREGGPQRRVMWLLRQLKAAPDNLLVEVEFGANAESTCERLSDVRDKPAMLLRDRTAEVTGFTLTFTGPLGTKRSGVRGAFIPSVLGAVETFYRQALQPVRQWSPPAPKLAAGSLTGDPTTDAGDEAAATDDIER